MLDLAKIESGKTDVLARDMPRRALGPAGWRAALAGNGREALEHVAEATPPTPWPK